MGEVGSKQWFVIVCVAHCLAAFCHSMMFSTNIVDLTCKSNILANCPFFLWCSFPFVRGKVCSFFQFPLVTVDPVHVVQNSAMLASIMTSSFGLFLAWILLLSNDDDGGGMTLDFFLPQSFTVKQLQTELQHNWCPDSTKKSVSFLSFPSELQHKVMNLNQNFSNKELSSPHTNKLNCPLAGH